MKLKKNLIENKKDVVEVDYSLDRLSNVSEYPPWYKQFLDLDESDRQEIYKIALKRVEKEIGRAHV